MSPRKRSPENVGLPKRWKYEHGGYYYQVPKGQEQHWDGKKKFLLGHTMGEAAKKWGDRMQTVDPEAAKPNLKIGELKPIRTVSDLLDRYLLEVTPQKALRTQQDEPGYAAKLRPIFGKMRPQDIEPQYIYKYFDDRRDQTKDEEGNLANPARKAKTQARNELKLLSHALTKAVEWGVIKAHPTKKEVRLDKERGQKARDRYIEDWERDEALKLKPMRKAGSVRMCQAYMVLKEHTGLRQIDLLLLKVSAARPDGILVHVSKTRHSTGRKQLFSWCDKDGKDNGLRAAWDRCLDARPVDIAPWVFCTDEGKCYIDEKTGKPTSFNSVWKRFMDRVLKETKLEVRFAERDIRAKTGSDLETTAEAQHKLGNETARITRKHYRRKPDIVR
jgi:hypothetical protein